MLHMINPKRFTAQHDAHTWAMTLLITAVHELLQNIVVCYAVPHPKNRKESLCSLLNLL
jgi:tRNA G46 methylase TrmB